MNGIRDLAGAAQEKLGPEAADRAIEVTESAGIAPEGADYWRGS